MKCLKTVEKVWGREEWLVNSSKYCAKYLWLKLGYACSLHWHPIKEETFIVISGAVQLEIYPAAKVACGVDKLQRVMVELLVGDTYTITPKTPHRFRAICGDTCVLEVSTTHDDSDVVRSVPSMKEEPPCRPLDGGANG